MSTLPENETDCYTLQQNATGPNYFYTSFFCQLDLPYLCEYEYPPVPDNFSFSVEIAMEDEVIFQWSNFSGWSQQGFDIFIKYYSDNINVHYKHLPSDSTYISVQKLYPGYMYNFIFYKKNKIGLQYLSPIISAETRPLYPTNLQATHISSTSINLEWGLPSHHLSTLICGYLLTVWDVESNDSASLIKSKDKNSTVITNLKSYQQYNIYIQTLTKSGKLSLSESLLTLVTAVSPPQHVWTEPAEVGEEHVILHWEPPQEISQFYISVKPLKPFSTETIYRVNKTNWMEIGSLVPGRSYKLGISAVKNGNMSEMIFIYQTLKPKPAIFVVPLEQHTHAVTLYAHMPNVGIFDEVFIIIKNGVNQNISFPLNPAGQYEINDLFPGTEYEFSIYTKSDGMQSTPYETRVKTCLTSPFNLREGMVNETSIQVVWDKAEGNFQQYEIICKSSSNNSMVQKVTEEKAFFYNLIPGTVYIFVLRTEKEQFRDSIPLTMEIQTVPAPPEYLNYTKDSESLCFNWLRALGQLDGYLISMTSEDFNRTEVLPPTQSHYTVNGLLPGTEYLISIVTTCGFKKSSPTNIHFTTDPDPPSALQVLSQEENSVCFSWKLPKGRYQHFELTVHPANSSTLSKITTDANELKVKNLSPGVEYRFQLRTINGKVASVPLEKVVSTRPAGICGLTIKSANTSSATLTWDHSESKFTHYRIILSNQTFSREYNVSNQITDYTFSNLTPGAIYHFKVQRMKVTVEGVLTNIKLVTEPEQPQELRTFNISSQSFSLSWKQPSGWVETYQVDLFPPHGFVTVRDLGGGEYQADVSSLAPGTAFTVTVSSVSSSAFSSPVSRSVVTNETIPGPPISLAGERVGSAGILLSWNVPRNPNGKILAYYVIFREVCPWIQSTYIEAATKPDSLEVLLTSLTPGTTYEIKVAAENSAGNGSFSESFLFQTAESAAGKVVNLTVEALNSSAVNLTWFLPRQPHGKITSFKISVKHARSGIIVKDTTVKVEDILNGALPECNDNRESFLWSTTSPSSTRGQSTTTSPFVSRTATSPSFSSIWNEPITIIVGQLRPYTTYLFEVSAVTSEPGYIDSTIVRTPESVPEDPPQNLVLGNITTRSFSVIWDAPTIVTGKFSYRVELYGPAGHILENSTKDLKFPFTNLTPFTTYNAYISGETSAGVGPRANISVFTPAEVPSTVSDLNATEIENNSIKVWWKKPQQPNGNITQYRVKTSINNSGVVIENVILKGKKQYNLTNPTSYISQTPLSVKEALNGVYEGSAEFSTTTQSMSSVIFHTNTNDNSVIETKLDGIDIDDEPLFHIIETLTPYTEYLISVTAFTTVGEGPPAHKVVRTGEQVPSSVENIMYENINSTTVKLSWDPPLKPNGMITNYTVYVMEVNSTKALAKTTTDKEILITDLKIFTEYKMRITASTSAGESISSEQMDIFIKTLEDVPGSPPQNLRLLGVNSTAITLAWSPPLEPNGIITHYEVIYTNSTDFFTQNTTSTSLSLTNLYPYTLYNISVQSYTRFGHGNKTTDVLPVRTSETAPSSPPYNLVYTSISSTEVLIEWKPPMFANGIIQFYNITYWNTSHFITNMSNESQVVLSDLKKYSQYHVVVSAYTVHGNGNQTSDILNITTLEDVPDSAPEDIKYTNISSTEIEVSFSPPLIPNGNIMYYTIYITWKNETMERAVNTTNITEKISGLKKYTSYFLSVSASTIKGEGIRSAPQIITTDEDAPSSPPRSLAFEQLSGITMKLSWEPPLMPNGIILNYTVYIWNEFSNKTVTVEKTFVELEHLETNNEYNAFVTTNTRFGDGNIKSVIIQFRTSEGAPSDPPRNIAYKNITSDSIMVYWTPPSKPNGIIQYYIVYYRNITGNYFKNITSEEINASADLQWTIVGGLAKFSSYNLWITASTSFGDGNQTSEKIDVKTDEDVPEYGPVIGGCINQTAASCLLTWDPPLKPNGIITNYSLELYGPQGNHTLSTYDTFIILADLTPYTQFIVSIAAATIKGIGPSNQFTFQTDEAEPSMPPQNLTFINASHSTASLHWSPSPKPNGIVLAYSFRIVENGSQFEFFQNITEKQTEGQLTALEPYKTYFVSVSAFTKIGNGNQFSNNVSFTTKESVPGIVQNIKCIATSYQSVLIHWEPPLQPNGMISHYYIASNDNTTIVPSKDQVYTFRELLSNTTYSFKIYAVNAAGKGQEQECNATTKSEEVPSAPRSVTFLNVESGSVALRWNRPTNVNGYLMNYKITVQLLACECNNWDANNCIEMVLDFYSFEDELVLEKTIYGLKTYRWYRLEISASTNAGYGVPSPWIHTQTLPGPADGPPQNITVTATSQSLKISWKDPLVITGPTSFMINVSSDNSEEYSKVFIKLSNESKNLEVTGLKPFTNYSVVVTAFTGPSYLAYTEGKSSSVVIVTTLEAVPTDPPTNIEIQKISNDVTKVQMTFIPPSEPNGKIQYQAVVYKEDNPKDSQIRNLTIVKNNNNSITAVIDGLKGGYTYSIRIYAVNGAGAGPNATQMRITTDITKPPQPEMKPVPMLNPSGSIIATATTFTIKMPICFFSDDNGPIKYIQIVVSEVGAQDDGNISRWHEAYHKKPKPYFTSDGFSNPSCPNIRTSDEYVIGVDHSCKTMDIKDKFCNGPLKPRKQYLFKFRATNIKGQYTDSKYSHVVKTLDDGLSQTQVEIILSVTLCVLSVILLVGAIYAFARIRQKQKEGGTYSPRDAEIIDTKFKLEQLITVADLELKDERLTRLLSYRKSLKPVSKKGFLQHVEELCTNNNLKFHEEFSELPKFLEDLAVSDADLPWNRSKNRFTNIKPYNKNRVKLIADAGVPGSDYINASYVSGYIFPNEFIATQGPLAGTMGDFWRMVWETRAKTIVMLTQCYEKGKIRSHQYWPEDNKPVTVFGDIVITKITEDVQIDWTTRDLKVERHGDYMMVRQCNYTSWPEHGVPESTASLLHFIKMIRAKRPHENTPTIVHCSAGVGRTGVFVALDHLIQHLNHHDFVDIYGLVAELRSERMCMVQNLAQYIFLHQCVVDLLASKGSSQPISFLNYSALQKMDSLDAMEGDVELEWEETTM
ncbi:hypothetical protein XELAEV_18021265mg [Xenopus laevis]|uniref:Protein-tyrosine-phosphatase n=1 Tax=Xenopus laevis TaxID=8355 RepID=A0A974D964_XENLA|nr:hypothetical protein XELAEV_18021265mg [Xenopus laevis]